MIIHHLCEFQALTEHFLMRECDNSELSENSILTLHFMKPAPIIIIIRV